MSHPALATGWGTRTRESQGNLLRVRCEQLVVKEEGLNDGATENVSASVVGGRTTAIVSPSEGASMRGALVAKP